MYDCFLDEEGGAGVNGAPQLTVPPAPTQFHAHGPGPDGGKKFETNPGEQRLGSVDDSVEKDCPLVESVPQAPLAGKYVPGSSQNPSGHTKPKLQSSSV